MKNNNLRTLSASLSSLKEIQGKLQDVMIDEEKNYDQLSQSEQEGEPGEKLGFEIDTLDNIEYLLDEVISFIEDNLGDRLQEVA